MNYSRVGRYHLWARDPWVTSFTRETFQSLNMFPQSYDNTRTLILSKKSLVLWLWKCLDVHNELSLSCYHFPLVKTIMTFIWRHLNCLYLKILSAKFGWYWPSGFEIWKVNRRTDGRRPDNRRSGKLTWAQMNQKVYKKLYYVAFWKTWIYSYRSFIVFH